MQFIYKDRFEPDKCNHSAVFGSVRVRIRIRVGVKIRVKIRVTWTRP